MLDPYDRNHPDFDKYAGFVPCRHEQCTNDDLHPWHPVTEIRGGRPSKIEAARRVAQGVMASPPGRRAPRVAAAKPPAEAPLREWRTRGGALIRAEWRCVGRDRGGCEGRGWTSNPCNSCPICFGRGVIDSFTRDKILGKVHVVPGRRKKTS